MNFGPYTISFAPQLPWLVIALFALVFGLICLFIVFRGGKGAILRLIAISILLLALLDPVLLIEERRSERDTALILVDRSPSNKIGKRQEITHRALENVRQKLQKLGNIDIAEEEFGKEKDIAEKGTELSTTWNQVLKKIPKERLAATIIIGDGQISDHPSDIAPPAPAHLIMTDDPHARDRQLRVLDSPGFGLIDKDVTIKALVTDLGGAQDAQVNMTISVNGKKLAPQIMTIGEAQEIQIPIETGDQNIVELSVPDAAQEITNINNKAVLSIRGIRDRLKVLLVSGEPYPGERMWRNMLKSDPAIDLVHFTILRPPEKQDATPISELALISFPVDELFYQKLSEFNLLIFDRFQHVGILPDDYFKGIIDYVRNGGAILEANGPTSATQFGLSRTELGLVLTGKPNGQIIEEGFHPRLSEIGKKHPVTSALLKENLSANGDEWGRWFRLIAADPGEGQILMNGPDQLPLLLLNHVEKGRVAQLFSDQLWLWQRGFEGGGPYTELIRRTMHWLMREPELEEERLSGIITEQNLIVTRHSLGALPSQISVVFPDGTHHDIAMKEVNPGEASGQIHVEQEGLYKLSDRDKNAFTAYGELNSKEWEDPRASPHLIEEIAEDRRGGIFQADISGALPDLHYVKDGGALSGSNWLGLRANEQYIVTGHHQTALLPAWAALLLALSTALWAWWREGR